MTIIDKTFKLHSRLAHFIKNDTRDPSQKTVSQITGVKRSTVMEAAAGAVAVKQLVETTVANSGTTFTGKLQTGPMLPTAIHQLAGVGAGEGADCWILAPLDAMANHEPLQINNNFLPVDDATVFVLGMWDGIPVAMKTSLDVSTAYNQGTDIRPELILKFVALLRSSTWQDSTGADMANTDWGNPATTLQMLLGVPAVPVPKTLAGIAASIFSGVVLICPMTGPQQPNPPAWFVPQHVYEVSAVSTTAITVEHPWFGGTPFVVSQEDFEGPNYFNQVWGSRIPKTPIVSAAAFGMVAPTPITSLPPVNAANNTQNNPPNTANSITPQEPTMTIAISPTAPTTIPVVSGIPTGMRIETINGVPDLGFVDPAGSHVDFSLSVAIAGTYKLDTPIAAISGGSIIVSVNGGPGAAAAIPVTGDWGRFSSRPSVIYLPAGPSTLRIATAPGSQCNFCDLTLTPAGVAVPTPTPAAPVAPSVKTIKSITVNVTYSDGSTESFSRP